MCVHTRECVFTCLCIAPIAPLKNVPRGSVLAKWEPRTEAWYELAERKEVRKTKACLDCKQNQDRGRWTEAMPTHRVSTYRMCWAVPNNRFSVHSLDIYNILLHYMQNNSLTPVDTSPPTHERQQYQHHLHWHVQWLSIGLISLSLS